MHERPGGNVFMIQKQSAMKGDGENQTCLIVNLSLARVGRRIKYGIKGSVAERICSPWLLGGSVRIGCVLVGGVAMVGVLGLIYENVLFFGGGGGGFKDLLLKNKVAIVIGGAQGIGECSEFASFVHCDVTIESDIENVINTTIANGSFITTASIASVTGGVGSHAYTSSKHCVVGLAKNAAAELGKYNIHLMHTLDVIMSMGDHASDMNIKGYCAYLCCCSLMFLGMTYMEVSREGYLEDAAERNSMDYAYYTPLA
ncbi:secoisolariciresinol dehydrogenase-like protein [Tanacetum coccineum]|uniref:Secoisolariciresinol dehydrogenase-like protein n=1 Tax=Tanacetum coccineum TaxID=301880 RepID=A0ABQ4Z7A0_9ASTR